MKKKIYLGLSLILSFSMLTACGNRIAKEKSTDKIEVVTSFNAIYDIASKIGGDRVDIKNIVPKGTEAHDFEPKPKDMVDLNKADVFVYNGLGMEGWVDSTLKSINNDKLVVVEATKNTNLIKNKDSKEGEGHGEFDPHVWLSLQDSNIMARNIMEAFIKVDGENKEYYQGRYKEFSEGNASLLKEYEEKFSKIENKGFVTSHAAFAYLCRDFKLQQSSVAGIFNDGEPTSQKLSDMVNFCKENNVKTIFMESDGSEKVAQTIAKEINGNVEKINTLESEGPYLETMRENLEKIYNSLK